MADGATHTDESEHGTDASAGEPVASPVLTAAAVAEVAGALDDGSVIALPGVGGYYLAVRTASSDGEERLSALATDLEGPHYAVGQREDVRDLTSLWSDEVDRLLERCWPGPVEIFLPRSDARLPDTETGPYDHEADAGAWALTVGMPEGRVLRKLCREHGPWRTVPLRLTHANEVADAFEPEDVACVVDGGSREGEPPTVVDATVTPVRVLREGALPAQFIEASMAMGARRRWFTRARSA